MGRLQHFLFGKGITFMSHLYNIPFGKAITHLGLLLTHLYFVLSFIIIALILGFQNQFQCQSY